VAAILDDVFRGVRAELLRRLDRSAEARTAYRHALALVKDDAERPALERRLAEPPDDEPTSTALPPRLAGGELLAEMAPVHTVARDRPMPVATFYFDLGSPYAYLAAERLPEILLGPLDWQPVSLGALFKLTGRNSWALEGPEPRRAGIAEVERRAGLYGLPPVRWPEHWPGNYLMAMRAAIFAFRAGRGPQFATCALRSAFQQGNDLGLPEQVLQAADDAGLDPPAVQQATRDPEIKLALREATDAAHARGVFGVPTIAIDDELFWGDDRLPDAADRLGQEAG
jgi:2-hydroxychromene-2-carboxylate isomerase